MKRRDFLKKGTVFFGGAIGGSVALSFGGNSSVAAAAEKTMRSERWASPSSITQLQCYIVVAKEKGYFAEEGLDIAIQATPGTASAITQVASGGSMFSQTASIISVPAIANQGAEIITVGQVVYKSVFEFASPIDKPITDPKQWQGKTIGIMSVGGTTDLLLDAMSITAGVDPKSATKVVTGLSAGAYAFLERGQVAGFFSFYALRVALEQAGIKLHYISTDAFAPMPPDSIIVSRSAVSTDANRDAVVRYLRACAKGMRYLLDPKNYAEMTGYLAKYNPIEAQDKVATAKKFEIIAGLAERPAGVPFMHCDDKAWVEGVKVMERMKLIKPDAKPVSEYYTNDFIKQI